LARRRPTIQDPRYPDTLATDLKALGLNLFEVLFSDATIYNRFAGNWKFFNEEYDRRKNNKAQAPPPDYRLRLTLIFHKEAKNLLRWPWEFLFIPLPSFEKGVFLTGERTELLLTRLVHTADDVQKLESGENELRILVAWSQPPGVTAVSADAVQDVRKFVREVGQPTGEIVKCREAQQPTYNQLKDALKDFKPHIVHLISHGKEGKVALHKDPDQVQREVDQGKPRDEVDWVEASALRALLMESPPRLVFLHACESALAPDSFDIFHSAAIEVLQAGVPAVIAMQYEIRNADANLFAKHFYDKLRTGVPIEEAVKAGRHALGLARPPWGHPRFGTPVVYLQSADGLIYTPPTPKNEDKFPCPYPGCDNKLWLDAGVCDCAREVPLIRCANPACGKLAVEGGKRCKWCRHDPNSGLPVPSASELKPTSVLGAARGEGIGLGTGPMPAAELKATASPQGALDTPPKPEGTTWEG
jgi:hypothetical protein